MPPGDQTYRGMRGVAHSPGFLHLVGREFESVERAEQWARQCGIFTDRNTTIKQRIWKEL